MKKTRRFAFLISIILIIGMMGYSGCGSDGGGNGNGEPVLNPPSTTTLDADTVSKDTANLTGLVNPKELATDYWFEWGTDPQLQDHVDVPEGHLDAGTEDGRVGMGIWMANKSGQRLGDFRLR